MPTSGCPGRGSSVLLRAQGHRQGELGLWVLWVRRKVWQSYPALGPIQVPVHHASFHSFIHSASP